MIGCERVAMCGVLVLISLPVIAGEPAQQTNGESAKSTLQVAPRLKPADIQKLRLPDVRITSAAHYGTKRLGIKVPHVQVNGMIGGTIGFELLLPDKWARSNLPTWAVLSLFTKTERSSSISSTQT